MRAAERGWARPLFVWEGAAGSRGRVELDWAFYETLAPRQQARARVLAHLALTNAASDLPDLAI